MCLSTAYAAYAQENAGLTGQKNLAFAGAAIKLKSLAPHCTFGKNPVSAGIKGVALFFSADARFGAVIVKTIK